MGDFLKNISKKLELSNLYTNLCIRCTTITTGKEKGLSNEDIALITGHKDVASIDRYDRPSDSRKHRLLSTLALTNIPPDHHQQCEQTEQRITESASTNAVDNVDEIVSMVSKSSGNDIQIFNKCTVYLQR